MSIGTKTVRAQQAKRSRAYRARKAKARLAADKRTCVVCGEPLKGQRADAVVCSDRCRVRGHRQFGQLRFLALDPTMERFKRRRKVK
jgi:predicted nucleic acid-binding Zn ribbon protein